MHGTYVVGVRYKLTFIVQSES